MANKWNQQEQGAKRRRSNQGTRGTARTQPAASNPNKNTKSTDTNRNSGRPAAAKPAPKAAPKAAPKQNKPKTVYFRSKDDAKPVYRNPAKSKPRQKVAFYSKDNARPVTVAEQQKRRSQGNVRQTIGGALNRAAQANASAARSKPAFRSRDYGKEQIKRPGEMNVTDYAWQTRQQDQKAEHNLSNQRKARQMYVESGQAALQRDLAKLDMRSGSDRRGKSAAGRLSIDYKTGKWYWDGKEMTQAQFDQQFPMGLSDPTAREMAEKAGYIVNTRYFPTKEDEKDKKQEIGWVARNMDKYAGMEADNVSDADAYDLMANRRKFTQAQAAGDKAAMERYHQANEAIRAKYGYSGGVAGDQVLRGNVSANEYAQLNETGDAALSNARRRLVNARTPAERKRIQKEIDWILTNPENQAGEENEHQIRDLTKGSVLSSIGNTAVQLRNIRDMNKYAGADDAYNAVPKLWQRVSELYDQMGNTTDEKQRAKIQKQIDWLTDQATAMEQEQEKWATDPNSPYFDPTVAERLGMPTSVQPNRWDEMAERGDQLIAGAKEGMNAGQSFAADLYSNAIQMIPTTAAGLIPGLGGASVGAKLWNAARGAAQIGALSQMGLAAGGARYRELVDRNVPRDQARTDALLATAIEMGTEALPLLYMGKLVGGTQRIGRTIPGAIAASAAIEGGEEGVSYAANALWSWMRGYEQDRFDWGEMGKSMLAGGIMGGLHAGLGVAVNRAVTHLTSQGREQDANRVQAYMDDIDGIMEQSRQYEEMVRQGALSAEEGAAIQSQLQQDLVGKMQSIQDHVRTIDSYQSMADQGIISQDTADRARNTYGQELTGQETIDRAGLEQAVSQRLYQAALAANAMNTETPAQAEARQAAERTGRVQDMYRRGQFVMGAYQANREAQLAREIREAQQTEMAEATTATSSPMEQTQRMGEDALVQANSALQQAAEARARAEAVQSAMPVQETRQTMADAANQRLESISGTMGEKGSQALMMMAGELNNTTAVRDFVRVYNQALMGNTGIEAPRSMTQAEFNRATEAGIADRMAGITLDLKLSEKAAGRNKNAGVNWSDSYVKGMDRQTAKTLDSYAKTIGAKIEFTEFTGANGSFVRSGNVITIAKDNPLFKEDPVLFVMGHESTHRMQDLDVKSYNAFRDYVMSLPGSNEALEETLATYRNANAFKPGENQRYAAMDEVTADYAGRLLRDHEELRQFIRDMQQPKVLRALLKAFRAVRDVLTGRQKAQADEAVRLLEEAIKGASERVKSGTATGEDISDGTSRHSISSVFSAAGLNVETRDGRIVATDQNGKEIKEVTYQMVNDSGIGAMINYAANPDNHNGIAVISTDEAKKQIEAATDLLNMMLKAQDGELVWRFAGSAMFSAVKSNSDGQYGTTIDFSTVCRKTQEMMTAMSKAMVDLGRGLTKEEVIELQADVLSEKGTVPCPVCYVFSRWAGVGGILDNMAKFQRKYGHEYDDPAKLDARIAELRKATKKKADLRAMLKEHDTNYMELTRRREEIETDTKAKKKERTALNRKKPSGYEEMVEEINTAIKANDSELARVKEDIKKMEDEGAPELAWLEQVRKADDYWQSGHVKEEVLFNMDDAATFAAQYPLAWRYRTTRGPSAGKAILPYSDMRQGDLILGAKNNSAKGNETFRTVENGEFNQDQLKAIDKAKARTLAQNLIGGQRFQSTSDFRYDYGLDYLQVFWEAQALGSKMQTYTKIIEFAEMVASLNGDVNVSMMPLNSGLDENGNLLYSSVTGMDIEAAKKDNDMYDSLQLILVGINDEHILTALDDFSGHGGEYVGFVIPYHASGASINRFIRGLVENLNETFNEEYYKDYSNVQTDSVKKIPGAKEETVAEWMEAMRLNPKNPQFTGRKPNAAQRKGLEQRLRSEIRKAILKHKVGSSTSDADNLINQTKKFFKGKSVDISDRSFEDLQDVEQRALAGDKAAIKEYESWSAGALWDLYQKMWVNEKATETYGVTLNTAQAGAVMPHEYWNKTVNREHAYVNGFIFRSYCYNLGLRPRFTGVDSAGREVGYGDFSVSRGYWKTLIDRAMYDNQGNYRDQQRINVTNLSNEMLTPEYGEQRWGDFKVAEPSEARASRAAQKFVERHQSEAEELSDVNVRYSIRTDPPPKKTGTAYKVFFAKDGQLYPPMVANPGGAGTPVGVWLDADVGQQAPPSKTGRAQVKAGGKGTQGGSGSLAFRPGWHLGDVPHATQFARMNPETGKKELFPSNFVWAECEYAADVDYQDEAMSYGYTENGKFRHSYAGLPRLPQDGYYRYRTNPKPDTVLWIITGAMKVKRILTDEETDAICRENGVEPMARVGGPLTAESMERDLGIQAGDTEVRFSITPQSDAGVDNVVAFPQNGRRSDAAMDETRIRELRASIQDAEDKLEFADVDDLSDVEVKRLQSRLMKDRNELDKLIGKERSLTRKTSIQDLLDNLDDYRRTDLESLAEQISDGAWDDYEELDDADLRDGIREMLEERAADLSPLEAQAARYGFNVRPPERYSLGTEGYDRARLMRENQDIRDRLETWRSGQDQAGQTKVSDKTISDLTARLANEYRTDMPREEIAEGIRKIYDSLGKGASFDNVYQDANALAARMVEQASDEEERLYTAYQDLRSYIRGTDILVSKDLKDQIPGYNGLRQSMMGRATLKNGEETNIDTVFAGLAEQWPEFFDPEIDTTQAAKLERIGEVLQDIYNREETEAPGLPEGYLAIEILASYFDSPAVRSSMAQKSGARSEAMRARHKERYDAALEKAREQKDKELKRKSEQYLTAKKKRSQQQKERELRAKIQRHVNRLSTKLRTPTDAQHIPEDLIPTVKTALESINLSSGFTVVRLPNGKTKRVKDGSGEKTSRTQAFEALRKMYQEMETNGSEVVIDPDLIPNISDIIGFADTPIANLGLEDLNTIWNTVKAIENSISTFNKALGRAKFETISQPAFGIRDYLTGRKDRGDYRGPFRQMDKLLNFNMLTPEAYFLRMGNSGKEVFRMLRDAQDRHITIMDQAQRKTREIIGKTDIRKLEKEKHTFTFDGETVELTTAQIMSLYELMKRQQAVDHVMIGGIRPESVKKGIKDLPPARPWHLTQDQVSEVVNSLTQEQVKLADELQKYMGGTMAELGNEASMEVYGYRKFTEKHYFPISVDKNQTQSDVKNDAVSGTIAGWGSARPVKPNANNAVILRSIFDVYADHTTEMANYASWLAPMENMNRIFNFRYKDAEGNQTGTMKDQLETLFGKNGEAYWKQLQNDLNNGVHGRDDSPFSAFMGTYKVSAIGANIRVIAQQPTAILRAMDSINPADFVAGMARARWGKFDNIVKQYAPIAIWKDWGYFQQDTGRQMRNVLFNDDTRLQRANSAMMWGAGKADSISWTAIWNALESETRRKRKDLRYKSREFYAAVAERFNEVVDHTQVVDGILQRSQIMRSADGLTKMATSFMAEPTKTYNMMLSAIYEARNAKGRERSAAMGKLARTAFALTVSITVNAVAQSLVDAIRDDDKDEEYWEKFIQAYFGLEGETRREKIKNGILNGNLEAAFNPLTYIPCLKDIISQTQGYTVSRMDMDTISRVLKAFQNVEKAMSGEGKNTRQSAWLNLTAEVARFLGIPAANIKRDIQTITRTFFAGTGNYRMLYEQEKFLYDVTSKNTLTEFSKLILGAERAGDDEAAQAIRQDMIDSGVDAEKIDKKIAELEKKAVTDTEEYQTALAQKTDAYHTMLEASPQYQEMDEELQGKVQDKLDSYAQYQVLGQSMEVDGSDFEKVQAAEASGVPAVDWAVLTVLKGSRNNYEENGKTIKVQDQMIETIDQMGGTDEEKSARYRTLYDSDKNNPWVKK